MINIKQLAGLNAEGNRPWGTGFQRFLIPKDGVAKRGKTPVGKALRQESDLLFARLRFCELSQIYPCRAVNDVCRRENRR